MGLFLKYLKQRKRYIAAGAVFALFLRFRFIFTVCRSVRCFTLRHFALCWR